MLTIEGANVARISLVKDGLLRQAKSGRRPHVGDVHVLPAVIIDIEPRRAHAGAYILHAGVGGDCSKGAVAVTPVEIVASEIIRHIQIGTAISVQIAPRASKTVTVVFHVETRRFGAVGKRAVAFVVKQKVWRPVARVEIGSRIVVLIKAEIVAVETEVNIKSAIAIVVGDGRVCECALRRFRKLESIWLALEGAVSLIDKQQRTVCADNQQILQPSVLKISEQSAGRAIEDAHPGSVGYVFKGAISAIAIKTIRQARRLANVQIIKPVIIEVSGGNSVVAINVDATRCIQHGAPVIGTAQQLGAKRIHGSESILAHIHEGGAVNLGHSLADRLPTMNLPLGRILASELQSPVPNTLLSYS